MSECQHEEQQMLGIRLRHDGTYDIRVRCKDCAMETLFCGCIPTKHQYDALCEAGGGIDFVDMEISHDD